MIKAEIYNSNMGEGNDTSEITIKHGDETIYRKSITELTECPEDAIFNRDMPDAWDFLSAFKAGYKAAGGNVDDIVESEVSEENE